MEDEQIIANPEAFDAERKAQIATAGAATEAEMRDSKEAWPKSIEELAKIVEGLTERPHDYGTCVYAMSLAAIAAVNYVASKLGCTGFQHGCAINDIVRRGNNMDWGTIQNYDNLLYPQYCDEEHFPSAETLLQKHRVELAKRARAKLAQLSDLGDCAPRVLSHWQRMAANG